MPEQTSDAVTTDASQLSEGDTVLFRAEVLEARSGIGARLHLAGHSIAFWVAAEHLEMDGASTLADPVRQHLMELSEGDPVLVRGTFKRVRTVVLADVEVFSKTDQYEIAVQPEQVHEAGYLEPAIKPGDLVRDSDEGWQGPTWLYLPDPDGHGGPFLVLTGPQQGARVTREALPTRLENVGPAAD